MKMIKNLRIVFVLILSLKGFNRDNFCSNEKSRYDLLI